MAFVSSTPYPNNNELRKQGLFCDAVFVAAGGQLFPVHKTVVMTAAPACASLFANEHEIKLPNVDGDTLESLLEFMYTGKLTLTKNTTNNILEAASLFGLCLAEKHFGSAVAPSLESLVIPTRHQNNEIDARLLAVIHEFWLSGKMTVNLDDAELTDLLDTKLVETAALFGLDLNNEHQNNLEKEPVTTTNIQSPPACSVQQIPTKTDLLMPHTATARRGRNGKKQLWRFLILTLLDERKQDVIAWQGNDGVFAFVNAQAFAELWGNENGAQKMSFKSIQRTLRNYQKDGILCKCKGEKFVYKFTCDMKLLLGIPLQKLVTMR